MRSIHHDCTFTLSPKVLEARNLHRMLTEAFNSRADWRKIKKLQRKAGAAMRSAIDEVGPLLVKKGDAK